MEKKAASTKVNVKVTQQERAPFTSTSAKACFEHFEPLARAVPQDDLEPCRLDVEIVRANVNRGIEAIRPELAVVRQKLPEHSIPDMLETHELSLALLFAAGKVIKSGGAGGIDERLATLRPMREAGVRQLEVFSILGLLPKEVPAAIRRGKGSLDAARDAQAIVGVFHDHKAAFEGKHPFTAEQLHKLGEDGDWLVAALKPTKAKTAPVERDPAAILRDQFFALLSQRHDALREAGVVVFGLKNLDDHIPPLGARTATPRTASATTKRGAATPAPAPAAGSPDH